MRQDIIGGTFNLAVDMIHSNEECDAIKLPETIDTKIVVVFISSC